MYSGAVFTGFTVISDIGRPLSFFKISTPSGEAACLFYYTVSVFRVEWKAFSFPMYYIYMSLYFFIPVLRRGFSGDFLKYLAKIEIIAVSGSLSDFGYKQAGIPQHFHRHDLFLIRSDIP